MAFSSSDSGRLRRVRGAILLGNRDKNFDQAMNTVVGRMKQLLDQPAAAADEPRK